MSEVPAKLELSFLSRVGNRFDPPESHSSSIYAENQRSRWFKKAFQVDPFQQARDPQEALQRRIGKPSIRRDRSCLFLLHPIRPPQLTWPRCLANIGIGVRKLGGIMLRLSRMSGLGWPAPDFALRNIDGRTVRRDDFADAPALLVAFICNHCPFVLHVIDAFAEMANGYAALGLSTVAISSNDVAEFPEDGPEHMPAFARAHGFGFPYLHDATQEMALAYDAICTPDFFLFGPDRALFYAGQFDSSRPRINKPPIPGMPLRTDLPVTGEDLRRAIDAVLAGEPAPQPQRASAGCSIKWLEGREPSWA